MARVLFIAPQPFFQWRGSPIRVSFNVLALAQLGFEVDLLTLPIGRKKEIPGVRIIRVANLFGACDLPIGPSALKAAFDILLLFKALSLVRHQRYDVIHTIEDAGVVGVLAAAVNRGRLVYEKHSDLSSYHRGPLRNLAMGLYGRMEAVVARRADAAIGTGPGLVRQIRNMAPATPVHHIFDIPSSLATSSPVEVEKLRSALQRTPEEILVTFVGSFAEYQGVDLIFDAVPRVLKGGRDVRFVIIGGRPAEIRVRRRHLAEIGAAGQVTFAGRVPPDELPAYLEASDILLSPRRTGINTPLKLLDYLKAGRSVAATDVSANRLILDEDTAVFTPPRPADFTAGIRRLVDDPDLRNRLGANGRLRFERQYNFESFKQRLKACYDELRLPLRPPGTGDSR